MTTTPTAPLQFLQGSTLNPVDVEVSSFPLDPRAEGTQVTFQIAAAWSNELINEGVASVVAEVVPGMDGRWSFRLSVAAFDTTNLPAGPYYGAFRIDTGAGVAYVPASGRLHVEILPAATVPA